MCHILHAFHVSQTSYKSSVAGFTLGTRKGDGRSEGERGKE